jgi:hypothetical protein
MTHYADALESKFAAVSLLDREFKMSGRIGARPTLVTATQQAGYRRLNGALRQTLHRAEPFYWAANIAEAVRLSSMSLPGDTTITLDGIPREGWAWFERPFRPGVMTAKENELRALHWFNPPEDPQVIAIVSFGAPPGTPHTLDMATVAVVERATVEQAMTDPKFADASSSHLANILRFFVASTLWIQQRIISTSAMPADRHCRKRLERAGIGPQLVNVVRLRRSERDAGDGDESSSREWSCQWIVRGHWRQQFYQSTGERKPLWIMPYVKGPEDAPLKTPTATVFAVTR